MTTVYHRSDRDELAAHIEERVERRGRSGYVESCVKEEVYDRLAEEGEVTQTDVDVAFVTAVLDAMMEDVSSEVGGPDGYRSLSPTR
ncbi:MAG: hypothetical protein SVW77_03305 [Candidatus Nanohaloarchaea archaeon]|nr:hypothetical protein [Candidatus Nanohaloarchaea archaeon]